MNSWLMYIYVEIYATDEYSNMIVYRDSSFSLPSFQFLGFKLKVEYILDVACITISYILNRWHKMIW